MNKTKYLSLDDFELPAKKYLPGPIFSYVSGGVEDGISVSDNRKSYTDYYLRSEVLRDVSSVSSTLDLFGHTYSAPVGIAPMGIAAITAFQGDLALAQAAKEKNVPFIMSGSSLIPLEEVYQVNPEMWFQAYLPGETSEILALVNRVIASGIKTLVITVDNPVKANRENNVRAGFSTPFRPDLKLAVEGITHPRWLTGTLLKTLMKRGNIYFENNYATRGAPLFSARVVRDFSGRSHITWEHIKKIRAVWKGALVIKGILSSSDAAKAKSLGVDGIIVSNHGGRQLDTNMPPVYALESIAEVSEGMTVMLDSGVRRGTDVIKSLALGAECCFVGRPFNYANSVGGVAGVSHAIDLITSEVRRDMGMIGAISLSEVSKKHLFRR